MGDRRVFFQNHAGVQQANALGDSGSLSGSSATAPGDIRFKDVNGDHVVDDKTGRYWGSPIPILPMISG